MKPKKKEKDEKPSGVTKESLEEAEEHEVVMMVQIPWMQAYISYILRKTIPDDPAEARRIIRRSKAFTVIKEELYKRSISGVLQRCVTPEEGYVSSLLFFVLSANSKRSMMLVSIICCGCRWNCCRGGP